MQNQTNTKYSSSPEDIFKSAKSFLDELNPKEETSKTTISKVLSKILNKNKTSKHQCNFCKDIIFLEDHDM